MPKEIAALEESKRNSEVIELITRIITGIVGIALAAAVIQTGGWVFRGVSLALSLIAWFEYSRAFSKLGIRTTFLTGILLLVLFWGCATLGNADEFMAVSTLAVLVVLLESVLFYGRISFDAACISVAGIFYTGLPFAHLIMLREFHEDLLLSTSLGDFVFGCALIWIMFIGTWASDTFAYFAGSAFGKHKLCSSISPNKTVEGFLGSLVGTTASVAGLGMFFGLPVEEMAVLGLCISVFATLGDLVESVMKRHTGIKDSGNLIPGHGGVLDRFDSVLLTAPFVYYFAIVAGFASK